MTPLGGKSIAEMSLETDNNHVTLYGQIVWRMLNLTSYRSCLIALIMEEEQELVGRQFNSFEQLEMTFRLSRLCEKHN